MKKQKTQAEIDAHEQEKKERREYRSAFTKAKRTMILLCRDKGLRTGEAQLQYAKKVKTSISSSLLSANATIDAWEQGIKEYKENIYQD